MRTGRAVPWLLAAGLGLATVLWSTPAQALGGFRADGAVRIYAPPRGSAQNPAFSPDGKTVLFTWFHLGYDRGVAGLYTIPLTGGQRARVLDEVGHHSVAESGAVWSAAANRIAFASDRLGTDAIWTIAADGSSLVQVTAPTVPSTHFRAASQSPGGQWIAFEAVADLPSGGQQGTIWKVKSDGSGLTQLTSDSGSDDREPNWSPVANAIVFERTALGMDAWNLYVMAVDGSGVQAITSSGSDTDPSWSPDGQSIVYSSDQGGMLPHPAIWMTAAAGGTPQRVTWMDTRADDLPSWSPDGTAIIFESHRAAATPAPLWRIAAPVAPPPPADCPQCWHPPLKVEWQWQLSSPLDPSVPAQVSGMQAFDIDLFDTDAGVVTALHAQGRKAICYIDAGTWEKWRPDADEFPSSVLGLPNGWPGERWLDIRQFSILTPIMQARINQCAGKGFDGVEFDNVDGYTNATGFPLTYAEQITYNVWLANAAHAANLSVALKNDLGQISDLLPYFDWELDEQCFTFQECDLLLPFINAGKPVMEVEYALATSQFCPLANAMNFNAMKKHLALDAYRVPCR